VSALKRRLNLTRVTKADALVIISAIFSGFGITESTGIVIVANGRGVGLWIKVSYLISKINSSSFLSMYTYILLIWGDVSAGSWCLEACQKLIIPISLSCLLTTVTPGSAASFHAVHDLHHCGSNVSHHVSGMNNASFPSPQCIKRIKGELTRLPPLVRACLENISRGITTPQGP